ncbi:hypothetical protein C8R44DRAFT_762051 [Mycena epipterygia]|nr:hypothetical protein C8R44DRAFT_762051 [Mycena epipterygia]
MVTDSDSRLTFIIVGASVAGLSSAIGLKASGHNVLVLEKQAQLGGPRSMASRCARIPPNGYKVLAGWGLEAETKGNSTISDGFAVYKYDGGKAPGHVLLGTNRWDAEFLSEARGHFLRCPHNDLLRILYDAATKNLQPVQNGEQKIVDQNSNPRVTVLFGAEVIGIDCDTCSVTLRSGDIHTGHAIIGADGPSGIARATLMSRKGAVVGRDDVPTGLTTYSALIPKEVADRNPDVALFYEDPQSTMWMGPNRGALTSIMGKSDDVFLWVYTPESSQDGTWREEAGRKIVDIIGPCDFRLRKLAALAGPATCVQIKDYYELESWVSESGKVLVLGEAAHPFPPVALHNYSVALEDGAFIGKIFSHTRDPKRVPEFLHAFEEHRKPRCSRIRQLDRGYIDAITLPDGEKQAERDAAMRASYAAGHNVMDAPDGRMQKMLENTRMIFDYDPSDDADEWWVSWGRFRDGHPVRKESISIKKVTGHER